MSCEDRKITVLDNGASYRYCLHDGRKCDKDKAACFIGNHLLWFIVTALASITGVMLYGALR